MKKSHILMIGIFIFTSSILKAQDISSLDPIVFPIAPANTYLFQNGSNSTILSTQSIKLLPGTRIEGGATALLKIGGVEEVTNSAAFNSFNLAAIPDKILCRNQVFQFDAGITAASYSWTSSNGFTSNQKTANISQAGTYHLSATSSYGLTRTTNFNVTVNDFDLKAEFLVSTVVNAGDTVYVIDVTKPIAPSVNWILPSNNMTEIPNSNPNIRQVVFNNPGVYQITMNAFNGGCEDAITKTVTVLEKEKKAEVNDALGYQPELIKEIKLYPNPSTGQFTVNITLSKIENVKVKYINMINNQIIEQKMDSGKTLYNIPFDHTYLSPGVYFVTVEVGTVVKTLKVVKI